MPRLQKDLLGATVWTGGHLVLAIGFLPGALKSGDASLLRSVEERFERVGIPALLLQIASERQIFVLVTVRTGEEVSDEDFKTQLEALNEELEGLNAKARELEQTIAANVAGILEG